LKIGISYHNKFSQYDLGPAHPFRGDRFPKVWSFLKERGLLSLPNVLYIKPKPASLETILYVHKREYVDLIMRLSEASKPYDLETPVSKPIIEALMLIIGGAMRAGDLILNGEINRAVALGGGFHHAGRDYGGGFCIFNDIAILIEHLRINHGLKRFLILDYDVHFGNGTSDIYYSDPSVLFISLHQDPRTIYPGTGFMEEIGEGEGRGYNINIPLPPRTGEKPYLYALREIFPSLAEEFKPEIIIANGGSDAHFTDALGRLGLTVNGFFNIAKTISNVAEKVCGGKAILMIGSGYNPRVLPQCWYSLIRGIMGFENLDIRDPYPPPRDPWQRMEEVKGLIAKLKQILSEYWSCF